MSKRILSVVLSLSLLLMSNVGGLDIVAQGSVNDSYTRVPITAISDLPGNSLIAGKTPTLANGTIPGVESGGNLANITDGLIQGVNQEVEFILSCDGVDRVATKNGHTYYSYIAPTSLVEAQGKDPFQTWYIKPHGVHWLSSTCVAQRAVLFGGSSNGGNIIYDLGEEATIDSLLIASVVELTGMSNYTYYDGKYNASKHPVMSEADLRNAMTPIVDNRLLYKGKVYVSNDRSTLFTADNLVLDFDLSDDYAAAMRNLWKLKEAAHGRYVGFGMNDTIMSSSNQMVRISELGVYGTFGQNTDTPAAAYTATTYNRSTMTANMTPRADNLLNKAVAAVYRAGAAGSPVADGKLVGTLTDGVYGNSNSQKLCPNGSDYIYFTYDLGKVYSLDTVTFVGDGYDGANGVAVYVSNADWPAVYEEGARPDAVYDRAIGTTERATNNPSDAIGLRFTFETPLLGRYVTFRLQACRNVNNMQVWASEFAVTGVDGTVLALNTVGATHRLPTASKNVLATADAAYYRDAAARYNSENDAFLTTLVDGVAFTEDTTTLTTASGYVYVTYDLGVPHDLTSLVYASDGAVGADTVALWVGNMNLSAIIRENIQPLLTYDGVVGADVAAVNFNLVVCGRYVTFRLGACGDAADGRVGISELAAVGTPASIKAENAQTIVCVGDTATKGAVSVGQGTMPLADNYPAQLEALLNAGDDDVFYKVINAGVDGAAVVGNDLSACGWLTAGADYVQSADKVLIMLGTNDAHTDTWSSCAPYFKEQYKRIIDAFRTENPEAEIYVVTSPYSTADINAANLADGVVPLQKRIAADEGLPLIDVYGATRYTTDVFSEDGCGVLAATCFEALTGDENALYVLGSEGAQLRNYGGGVLNGTTALRFGVTVPVCGVTMNDRHDAVIAANSTITIADKAYPLVGMGTVVAVKDKLKSPYEELVAGTQDDWAKEVPADKLYSADENGVTYTAVVTNIRQANYDAELVARGYVAYRDGDDVCYAYGPLMTRSASEVASAYVSQQLKPTYDVWKGFRRMTFTAGGVECYLVLPDDFAEGRPWVWRTEFFGTGDITDLELLRAGWVLGYCRVSNMYGSPAAISIMNQFYQAAVPLLNLKRQAVLYGVSRGGLYAVNYAAAYPADVAGLYLSSPVQDICSWPAYLYTENAYDQATVNEFSYLWPSCRSQHGFATDAEALADRTASPRWKYGTLLAHDIPVLLAYGDRDKVVLYEENGKRLVDAYNAAGKAELLEVQLFPGGGHCPSWPEGASAYILAAMN